MESPVPLSLRDIDAQRQRSALDMILPPAIVVVALAALSAAIIPRPEGLPPALLALTGFTIAWECNRRGRTQTGFALVVAATVLSILLPPLSTGDLGTASYFLGAAATLLLVLARSRQRLLVLVLIVGSAVLLTLFTDSRSTPPLQFRELVIGGIAVSSVTAVVGLYGWRVLNRLEDAHARAADSETQLAAQLEQSRWQLSEALDRRTRELQATLAETDVLVEWLAETSIRDPLTGLYNRRHLQRELTAAFAHAQAGTVQLCVAVLDVDDLKRLNDSVSHLAGDALLARAAGTLATVARAPSAVWRLGGDEFLLASPTDNAGMENLVRDIGKALVAQDWSDIAPGLQPRFSYGIAQTVPSDESITDVIDRADSALLIHKAAKADR